MTQPVPHYCAVCGNPPIVHLTEIRNGIKTQQCYCGDHVPPNPRDSMPFPGAKLTPAEQIKYLRERLELIDVLGTDLELREQIKAEIQRRIAELEVGGVTGSS